MRHSAHAAWAALALILAAGGQARGDNLVVNGGFETSDLTGWKHAGSFMTVTGGPSHVGNYIGGYGPHSGDWYIALGSVQHLGKLSQTLTTTPGQNYTLGFFLANDGGTPNEFRVDWNGVTVFDQTNIGKHGYTGYTFNVQATGTTTDLTFLERNDPGYLSLDDITVATGSGRGDPPPVGNPPPPTSNPPPPAAAPEPSSVLLLSVGILGVVGFAGFRWRRQSSGHFCGIA